MNPEAIEAAAKAEWARHGPSMPGMTWQTEYADYKNYLRAGAETAIEAAAPHLIREEALKRMVSLPWFEELVMAEALAFHSGGNCRFETEARAAELEAAAESLEWVRPEKSPCGDCSQCCGSEASCDAMRPSRRVVGSDWLRARAAAIRAGD